MKNLNVRWKLITSHLIIFAFALITGTVGIIGLAQLSAADSKMYDENTAPLVILAKISDNMQTQDMIARSIIIKVMGNQDPSKNLNDMASAEAEMEDLFKEFAPFVDDAVRTDYEKALSFYNNEYVDIKKDFQTALASGEDATIMAFLDKAESELAQIRSMFESCFASKVAQASDLEENNSSLAIILMIVMGLVVIVAVITSVVITLVVARMIAPPLRSLASAAHEIALGNTDVSVSWKNKDEIGELADAFNSMTDAIQGQSSVITQIADGDIRIDHKPKSDKDVLGNSLVVMIDQFNTLFSEICSVALEVSNQSEQIADGSQSLAQGSTEQAAAVEELSVTISDIAEKAKKNSNMATEASKLSESIRTYAERGSRQMDQMMDAVRQINEAGHAISKVIKVIDELAFQTNILAINASVEAAHAGQHGKGFAVVADEVRNLAAKSAEAAKDTARLIANSMEKSELGARIATETSSSLSDIVNGINDSARLIEDIATASETQTVAISEVNKGIDQVAQVVSQNSATSEESAAAAHEMSQYSSQLTELVTQFKIKENTGSRTLQSGKRTTGKSLPAKENHVETGFGKY